MKFLSELRRRNVVRIAIAYAIVGWLVFQMGEVLFPAFDAPDWVFKTVILLVVIGFPFVIIAAWAFELTPDGVKKTREVDISSSVTASTGRKLDFVIIGALVAALGYFIWERETLLQDEIVADDAAAAAAQEEAAPDPHVGKKSIAVIPFVNMSSDEEQEWFADGLTEEILNSLARTPDLLVSARTSSFVYKGSSLNAPEIAAELGVEHILEGSVRRGGDRLRVVAQLIRASDGFHLWSETYDRQVDDLIDIQENVAIEIANALETAMDPEALKRMVSSGTSSVPAFEAYLRGLSVGVSTVNTGDPYRLLDALEYFERAVAIDGEFALAHWQLAQWWSLQIDSTLQISGITELPKEAQVARYLEAVDNAIRFEKDEARTHLYHASRNRFQIRYNRALQHIEQYLEHYPNSHDGQYIKIILLTETGLWDRIAETVSEFAERDGNSAVVTNVSLTALLWSDSNEYMTAFARSAKARFNDNVAIQYQVHRDLLWAGDIDGASNVLPNIIASDMSQDSRWLAEMRQACAENRVADAKVIYDKALVTLAEDDMTLWLFHLIMGNDEAVVSQLSVYDDPDDLVEIANVLNYGSFDVTKFPHLQAYLQRSGIERPPVVELPYKCTR